MELLEKLCRSWLGCRCFLAELRAWDSAEEITSANVWPILSWARPSLGTVSSLRYCCLLAKPGSDGPAAAKNFSTASSLLRGAASIRSQSTAGAQHGYTTIFSTRVWASSGGVRDWWACGSRGQETAGQSGTSFQL
jgi:hypothetical protein